MRVAAVVYERAAAVVYERPAAMDIQSSSQETLRLLIDQRNALHPQNCSANDRCELLGVAVVGLCSNTVSATATECV